MRDSLDGIDLANTIRLLVFGGTPKIIVVEGESDVDVLHESFDAQDVELLAGYGKPSLLDAAAEIEGELPDAVRFLVDADFDRLTSISQGFPGNVYTTDHYDLLLDVVEVAPELVSRIARINWPSECREVLLEPLISMSWELATEVGLIRYASAREGWNLNTSRFPIHSAIPNSGDATIDTSALASMVLQRTTNCTVPLADLTSKRTEWSNSLTDHRLVVNSHDLLSALCQVGRKRAGATASTGYETQLVLIACKEMHRVPVIAALQEWSHAA